MYIPSKYEHDSEWDPSELMKSFGFFFGFSVVKTERHSYCVSLGVCVFRRYCVFSSLRHNKLNA